MLRTRAGYCGGTKGAPTYYALGDHTEAVAIDFDPSVTTYGDLLDRFWSAHHCGSNTGMRQYRNAVFYHNESQRKLAEKSRARAAARAGIPVEAVKTAIVPAGPFTYAELYHQKYALTRHPALRSFLEKNYPDPKSFADSTVATRLNAFLGSGTGRDARALARDLPGFGLPKSLANEILAAARRR